jgi:hypothetical protein
MRVIYNKTQGKVYLLLTEYKYDELSNDMFMFLMKMKVDVVYNIDKGACENMCTTFHSYCERALQVFRKI